MTLKLIIAVTVAVCSLTVKGVGVQPITLGLTPYKIVSEPKLASGEGMKLNGLE